MSWTNPRILQPAVVAIAPQTAYGTPASSAGAVLRCAAFDTHVDRGQENVDPQGTTGSEYPRDTLVEVAIKPVVRIRFYAASRPFLAALLGFAMHGALTALQASSDLVVAGDTGSALGSTGTLSGVVVGINTDTAGILYAKYEGQTPAPGSGKLSLYSDSGRTALVASGSHAYAGTITLAAQNSSGLSGTWPINSVTASNLTGITITVARVRTNRAAQVSIWFTLFRDTGRELETIGDCAVKVLRFSSAENGPLEVELEVAGASYSIGATALTAGLASYEKQQFVHAAAGLTINGVAQSHLSLAHGVSHEIAQHVANAAAPVSVHALSSKLLPIVVVERFADESRALVDAGVAGSWVAIVATYTYGSKTLVCTYARCKAMKPVLPDTADRQLANHTVNFEARDDGTNAPLAITIDI